jgi:hypothetical protein
MKMWQEVKAPLMRFIIKIKDSWKEKTDRKTRQEYMG